MQFHTTFSVPSIRAAQLRHIATKRETTPLELIDAFVRAAWTDIEGEGAPLPGFELAADIDGETGEPVIIFGANLLEPIFLTPAQAQAVAAGIEDLIDGVAPRFEVEARCSGYDARFIGTRKGRGFTFTALDRPADPTREPVKFSGFTVSLAADLAASFSACATKAIALHGKATK